MDSPVTLVKFLPPQVPCCTRLRCAHTVWYRRASPSSPIALLIMGVDQHVASVPAQYGTRVSKVRPSGGIGSPRSGGQRHNVRLALLWLPTQRGDTVGFVLPCS